MKLYLAKITTRFEGYHCWAQAPEMVSFLRNKHRHIFHVTVLIEQEHDDRDIEYIMTKWDLDNLIKKMKTDLKTYVEGTASCEMMAEYIYDNITIGRNVEVEVLEDGENGAIVK